MRSPILSLPSRDMKVNAIKVRRLVERGRRRRNDDGRLRVSYLSVDRCWATPPARPPARHAVGCRALHHQAAQSRARGPELQAAMEALLLVAKLGGPTMFARIGVMRALNRHVERVFDSSRKDTHWVRRKLARDR